MSEILSQEEIDALLTAFSSTSGPAGGRGSERPATREVRLYDFAHPEQFSKEQLRQLEAVHKSFASTAASRLSAMLRTGIDIQHTTIDQCAFDDYLRSIPNPTLTSNFRMEPSQARCIVEVNPNVAMALVDVMTGGKGDVEATGRSLTDIEVRLMETVIRALLSEYEAAWEPYTRVSCPLEKAGSNQMVNPIAHARDRMLNVCYEVTVGKQMGLISFCSPSPAVEELLQSIGAQAESAQAGNSEIRTHIADNLGASTVLASAWLGQAEVSVGDLLGLQAGDMVRLEQPVNREISLALQDVPKFLAVAGVVGSRLALQITREAGADSGNADDSDADKDAA